jgi:hypothetical protein
MTFSFCVPHVCGELSLVRPANFQTFKETIQQKRSQILKPNHEINDRWEVQVANVDNVRSTLKETHCFNNTSSVKCHCSVERPDSSDNKIKKVFKKIIKEGKEMKRTEDIRTLSTSCFQRLRH